ncbi:DUF4258 domain-containing protein [bacterium]|nr:DUF4258 domain-containing protein [bacterium]
MKYSKHFEDMLLERKIDISWINVTLENPEKIEIHKDGTKHFIRRIKENGNRYLRVVINEVATPTRAVTAFFDRRLRRRS